MQHAWILDVLTDLLAYAEMNNLPATALAARQTLAAAETEIATLGDDGDDPGENGASG